MAIPVLRAGLARVAYTKTAEILEPILRNPNITAAACRLAAANTWHKRTDFAKSPPLVPYNAAVSGGELGGYPAHCIPHTVPKTDQIVFYYSLIIT